MTITIHRGSHQIGGCVTEYESDGWRLFVDYGEELPGGLQSGGGLAYVYGQGGKRDSAGVFRPPKIYG